MDAANPLSLWKPENIADVANGGEPRTNDGFNAESSLIVYWNTIKESNLQP